MKLRAAFPKGELNGLAEVHNDAVSHVGKTYLVVAQVRVLEVITDYEKARDAKYGIERIEVVDPAENATIAEMIEAQFAARTGKAVLDLDMPDVIDLRKVYAEKRKKGAPTLRREPGDPVPVVDPSALAPDETGEETDPEQPEDGAEAPEDVLGGIPVDEADDGALEDAEAAGERAAEDAEAVSTVEPSVEEEYEEQQPGIPFDEWLARQNGASSAHTPTFSG